MYNIIHCYTYQRDIVHKNETKYYWVFFELMHDHITTHDSSIVCLQNQYWRIVFHCIKNAYAPTTHTLEYFRCNLSFGILMLTYCWTNICRYKLASKYSSTIINTSFGTYTYYYHPKALYICVYMYNIICSWPAIKINRWCCLLFEIDAKSGLASFKLV